MNLVVRLIGAFLTVWHEQLKVAASRLNVNPSQSAEKPTEILVDVQSEIMPSFRK